MQIVLLTLGTRGDVQPFVALGRRLRARGHDVRLCTCERFRGFIESHDLEYGYLDDALIAFIESDAVREMIGARRNSPLQWIRAAWSLLPQVKEMQRRMLVDQWAACRDADLLIYHPKALGGPHIAEKRGIPAFAAPPFPAYVPTREFPMLVLGAKSWGSWINRRSFAIARRGQAAVAGIVNEFRTNCLGLAPRGRFSIEPLRLNGSPIPVMHPFSTHVLPRPADWPEHATATGYWFLDADPNWQPSPELEAFLNAGDPPVYIGFGSMVTHQPARMARIAIEAVERAGVRAILGKGWGGLQPEGVPECVHLIEEVPHDRLLPRCSAVVHHGGAGSTAAGLRAGRPTLVVPHAVDQPLWARRVAELGVGPKPIPKKRFAAETLVSGIRAMLDDRAMQTAAAALGAKLEAERGIENAVSFLNRFGAAV